MESSAGSSSGELGTYAELGSFNLNLKGEDAWDHCGPINIGGEILFLGGVFDGHGGKRASQHCRKHLLAYVIEALAGDASSQSIRNAAVLAWQRAHADVVAMEGGSVTDGCTATACVLNMTREELTTINAGDSAAMIVPNSRKTAKPALLSDDHRLATSELERQRVVALGATLAHAKRSDGRPGGPLRLWPGGVAQARAIGDADVGKFIDPTPSTHTTPFPPSGFAVLVCSDGVWDAMLPTAVAGVVRRLMRLDPERTAQQVCNAAVSQWFAYDQAGYKIPRDDTTCVLIRVRRPFDEAEQRASCFSKPCKKDESKPKSAQSAPTGGEASVASDTDSIDLDLVAETVAETLKMQRAKHPEQTPTEQTPPASERTT